jgi:LysM repeat protein
MNKDPSTLIHSYKRRQQIGPFILWGAVTVLVVLGLVFLIIWLSKPDSPVMMMLASATPTATITPSPTDTPVPTDTPTVTLTPTDTATATASAPFDYTVLSGDSLDAIAKKFNLGADGIQLILLLNPYDPKAKRPGIDPTTQIIYPGLIITIPNPGMPLPSSTPIPSNLPHGTKLTYTIQTGDTLASIASKFNSTVDDIQKQNNITDPNKIQVGQQIVVRANLVTPTTAPKPTITQGPSPTPPSPFTSTPPAGAAAPIPSATATP